MRCTTLIPIVAEVTGCSKAAVIAAARLHNIPVAGNLLRKHPDQLSEDFYLAIHQEDAAITRQQQRLEARHGI